MITCLAWAKKSTKYWWGARAQTFSHFYSFIIHCVDRLRKVKTESKRASGWTSEQAKERWVCIYFYAWCVINCDFYYDFFFLLFARYVNVWWIENAKIDILYTPIFHREVRYAVALSGRQFFFYFFHRAQQPKYVCVSLSMLRNEKSKKIPIPR